MTDWKNSFKKDIDTKLKYAELEYDKYLSTDYVIYLQQAGNKLFSAVENYLMLKHNKKLRSYRKIHEMVRSDIRDVELLTQAVQLHYFFYNGDLHMDRYTAEDIYKIVMKKMKNRIK